MKINRLQILLLVFLLSLGLGQLHGQMDCASNIIGELSSSGNNAPTVKIFAQSLVNNEQDYTGLEVSKDGVEYGPSITFDCDDIGPNDFFARGTINGNIESCSSELSIQDNMLPVLVAHDEVYTYQNVAITVEQVDNGSFDNCGIVSSMLSETTFSDIGTYQVTYTLSDLGGNFVSQGVTVHVVNYSIACNASVFGSLDNEGNIVIYPQDIVEGGPYVPDLQIFNQETGEGGEFLSLDCADIGTFTIEVVDPNTGNSCFGLFTVEDKLKPIPYAQNVTVSLNGGSSVTISSATIDVGSFDNCDIADMSLSQSTFTANGTYTVMLTVTDPSGNSDFANALVTVIDGIPTCNESVYISLNPIGEAVVYGDAFIEGNGDYDVLELSLDNVNFGESVTFDCDDIGTNKTVYVHIENDGNEYNCTSEAMVEDKLAPVVIVNDFTIDLASESDTYTLMVNDVVGNSFDNCTIISTELSQTEFNGDNWGQNEVVVTVTDAGGQTASATSIVTVLINGQITPLVCISNITASTSPWGGPELWGVDFVIDGGAYDQVLASLDPAGPYTESFIAPCGVNGSGSITVYIQATFGTEQSVCSSDLTIVDITPPVPVVEQTIILNLVNGTATLTTDMVDNGSYDSCTDVILSLDQTEFTVDDIGINSVAMTVTDLNGIENTVMTNVIVDDGNSCTLDFVIYPVDISIVDINGTVDGLSIENLQEIYGFTYEEVYPYTASECESIFYAYNDVLLNINQGYKVIRTWTALDWLNNDTETAIQILKLFISYSTTLVCNDLESIFIQNGSVTLWPSDVLEGGPYNFDNMILTLEDSDGNVVVDNLITSEYVGQTLMYTVTDTTTESSCYGNVLVEEEMVSCTLDEDNLSFPLATIQVPDSGIDPAILRPEYLHDNYGYEWSEVLPTWPAEDCLVVGYSIEDNNFDYGGGIFKIVRNFTIIDWVAYDPVTLTGIWTFTQIINVGIDPNSLICDYLPRTADVGDCDSGHTLDDDVEWPADISIADYRIKPAELVSFSMVDVLDSKPSFYNNPDNYEASYQDLLVELTSTTVTVGRVWTVTHLIYDFTWTYTQTIVVDFSDFENLVSVSTGTNRAMPGVKINDDFTTNMQGVTFLNTDPVNKIEYEDNFLNGINILDLVLIQRHILNINSLEEFGIIAADANYDDKVTAADLLEIRKRILGVITSEYEEWRFYSKEINSPVTIEPKGAYLGIKAGDVDDSALLAGEILPATESNFSINDLLLNNGESYSVPVFLNKEYSVYGVQFRTQIDTEIMEILNVTSDYISEEVDFFITEDNILTVMFSSTDPIEEIGGPLSNPIFTIEIKAKQNSLLSLGIELEKQLSYLAKSNLELAILGSEVENMIGTGTNSVELNNLKVYPNPTVEYLYFDLKNVSIVGDVEVSVFGLDGQKIFTRYNSHRIDVSDLNAGMYYYNLKIDSYTSAGKFMVVK